MSHRIRSRSPGGHAGVQHHSQAHRSHEHHQSRGRVSSPAKHHDTPAHVRSNAHRNNPEARNPLTHGLHHTERQPHANRPRRHRSHHRPRVILHHHPHAVRIYRSLARYDSDAVRLRDVEHVAREYAFNSADVLSILRCFDDDSHRLAALQALAPAMLDDTYGAAIIASFRSWAFQAEAAEILDTYR